MGVYIGQPIEVSDMQGPAPDGFHVPLTTEWKAVYDIWTALGGGSSAGTNFGIALKLPFAGNRRYSAADVINQGSYGFYWSSSRYDTTSADILYLGSSALDSQSNIKRSSGSSVRCFKNTPTIPTSSWTKLYGTSIESGGIFWSSTDGLISLSSDGQTWVTIADKNLGATTVWNSGDTLSEANSGKYYQWGNNYGFPFTGSVTTSSTQVDASNYGPGNYYSSSTFITYDGRWDSTDNGNLRGGESQGTSEGVAMSELKNAYIGEYVPPLPYLCFTAESANSTVQLAKYGSPYTVTLETSTDGSTWSTYTFGSTINLSNIGDKVYFRNTSETDTGFSKNQYDYYWFFVSGSVACSGDITYLLNKNGTTTVPSHGFRNLFYVQTSLTSAPKLPATAVGDYGYYDMFNGCTNLVTAPTISATTVGGYTCYQMFYGCTNLEELPELKTLDLASYCYYAMFQGCSKIKLSTTQTGAYQTAYRIPTTGTGVYHYGTELGNMFFNTGGTFTGTPSINTTYYTSNTIV